MSRHLALVRDTFHVRFACFRCNALRCQWFQAYCRDCRRVNGAR
jgi:hypothetical protein